MKFFLLLFLSPLFVFAQLKNDSLEYRMRPDELRTGELALSIYNFNFQRNYEFFNRFQDGYTLFGTQLEPQLAYYAHPQLLLTAGIHLRKDFGEPGITRTIPLFSIKFKKGDTYLINGVLEGNIEHRYIEPIYDIEKKIIDPIEYGTQFIIDKPNLFLDAWINWKKMIYKYSDEQEEILGGISSDIVLLNKNKIRISTPLQFVAYHKGGQIDVVPDPLQTFVNTAVGIKINYELEGFVKGIRTENYVSTFNEFSFTKQLPFSNGTSTYLNAAIDTKFGSLIASYWNGNNFYANQGMPIYQSISQQINNQGYTEKKRELLVLRYQYQKRLIPNLYLDFRVEPFIDLQQTSNSLNFHHSTFLVYKQQFRIIKGK